MWRSAVQVCLGLHIAVRQCASGFRAWDYIGGLAQLARAPALQAGGQRFESVILHEFVRKRIDEVNPVPDTVGVLRRIAFFDILRQKRHKIRISVTPSCCLRCRRFFDGVVLDGVF